MTNRVACVMGAVLATGLAACQHHREDRLVRVPPTSERILGQAAHVVLVRVVARDPIEVPYKKAQVSCGSYYRVEVIETLKGEPGETLDFVADEQLAVGSEYLVAVRESPGSVDPSANWDTERLHCGAGYQRLASDAARLEPGADGMLVVVRDAHMLPASIRDQAVGGRVPWQTVKRELFAAATPLEQQVEELAAPEEVASPTEPEPATAESQSAPPQTEPAPAPKKEPEPPKPKSPWIWEWDPF